MEMTNIKTKEEAKNKAIAFQSWQSNQSLSYADLINWSNYFDNLAREFDLIDEFSENGII